MKKIIFILSALILKVLLIQGQSINSKNLDTLLKIAERTHSEAIIIYQNNIPVVEKYFGQGTPQKKIEAMSCTKSIVGLSVACLLSDKLIDNLDTPVSKYFPEWRQGQKQIITIRHLVNMTSGLQNNLNASIEIYPSPDFVQLALAAELSDKPGEVWAYNNKSLNLMAGLIKKITGQQMDKYISERLFKPLGITDFGWSLDSAGNPHVMAGCQITATDFVKLGLLVLNKGRYNNQKVIEEKYINELLAPCKQYEGYGMLWWIDYAKTTSVVDDEIIADMKKRGLKKDFIDKVILLKGSYQNNEIFYARVEKIFGSNPWPDINQSLGSSLRLRKKIFSGNISYRADGYLGNYIIVNPKDKIVAIRMISYDSYKTDIDNFFDFGSKVLELVNTR